MMTPQATQLDIAPNWSAEPLVAFLLIVCITLLVYLLYGADSDGPSDVYVARHSVRPVTNALALAGDHISVITLLTTTGAVALGGYDGITPLIGVVGALGVLVLLAQPLRSIGRYTLGDTLGARFPGAATRVASTVATLCFCLPMTVVQLIVAGGSVAGLLGISDINGATQACTGLIGALMICVVALSGMRGNTVVQAIKTVVLLLAMMVLASQVLNAYGWNAHRLLDAAARNSSAPEHYYEPGLLNGGGTSGFLSQLSQQITVILGAGVAPHMLMRLNTAENGTSARRMVKYTIGLLTLFCVLVVLLGLGASALVGGKSLHTAESRELAAIPLLAERVAATDTGGGMILALIVPIVFLTSLTVVAALTLSSSASLAHDVYARMGGRAATSELRALRWAAVLFGTLAVTLSVGLHGKPLTFLVQFAVTAAAAAILPALVLELFWSGFTRAGMLWSVYGGLGCCAVLQFFSPSVSGTPASVLPDADFAWFPFESTGLVAIPVGFLLAWVASRLTPTGSPTEVDFVELEKRALTDSVALRDQTR
ncbi:MULTISPECIES: sodium/solute symporter [unclassified Streptomyces]|uniref:sodium/solute symporter n=1 Tax=unclassified Streptomyces TaxID=2593676 RepID=UPI00403CCF86